MDLRHQVGVAASVLCFAIVATVATGAAWVGRQEAMNAASANLNTIAVTFADRLDRGIAGRLGIIQHLASLDPLHDIWEGPPDIIRKTLEQTRAAFDGTAWIGFATIDGIIKSAADGVFEGRSVTAHAWFRHGLVGPSVEDVSGAEPFARVGDLPDESTPDQRFIDIGLPVKNRIGVTVGVLGLHASREWADVLRRSTAGGIDPDQRLEISLLARNGDPVLGGKTSAPAFSAEARAAMISARRGVLPDVDASGNLTGFAVTGGSDEQGGLGWLVVVREPAAIAYGAATRVVWIIVLLGLVVGFIGIVGAMLIAGRVSRPFRTLANKAGSFGRDQVQMLPRVRGSLEAVRLSTALRSLILRLGSAERSTAAAADRAEEEARKFNQNIALLKNLADIDALTELLNRRSFLEFAEEAMAKFRHDRHAFAVLMIDIDHFKKINDNLGHTAGDVVIQAVASLIAKALRPGDRAARFGGEEFVVLLSEISAHAAVEVAERVRGLVASSPIVSNGDELRATVSVGIALSDESDRDIRELIERSDLALYRAKGSGRNCLAFSPIGALAERRSA